MLVSIDESGLSERPKRVRAWAPAGQIPVIQFHFNWKHVPAIASLSCNNCLFRLHNGAALHRSRIVRDYVDSTNDRVQMTLLAG